MCLIHKNLHENWGEIFHAELFGLLGKSNENFKIPLFGFCKFSWINSKNIWERFSFEQKFT